MTQINNWSQWVEKYVFGEGTERIAMSEQEQRELAIHEAGHFVANQELLQERRKMWCITIIPTEKHFGSNMFLKGQYEIKNREDYENEIAVLVSGKIASEQMGFKAKFYEEDLIGATEYALEYVERNFPKGIENKEKEASVLISRAGKLAKKVLQENEEKLKIIAEALLVRKILLGEEAEDLYNGTLTIKELEPLELD